VIKLVALCLDLNLLRSVWQQQRAEKCKLKNLQRTSQMDACWDNATRQKKNGFISGNRFAGIRRDFSSGDANCETTYKYLLSFNQIADTARLTKFNWPNNQDYLSINKLKSASKLLRTNTKFLWSFFKRRDISRGMETDCYTVKNSKQWQLTR